MAEEFAWFIFIGKLDLQFSCSDGYWSMKPSMFDISKTLQKIDVRGDYRRSYITEMLTKR